jgi:uncharacterized protein with PIN domain
LPVALLLVFYPGFHRSQSFIEKQRNAIQHRSLIAEQGSQINFRMAILDLDKIIFHKTTLGINCRRCGGNLKKRGKKTIIGWIITLGTLSFIKTEHYQCENCNRKYTVL